jgi:hypothetical protein
MEGVDMDHDDSIDLKLELLRNEMRAGFAEIKATLNAQNIAFEKDIARVSELEKRLRDVELESARSETKFKIFSAMIALGSGGAGALLSKIF